MVGFVTTYYSTGVFLVFGLEFYDVWNGEFLLNSSSDYDHFFFIVEE